MYTNFQPSDDDEAKDIKRKLCRAIMRYVNLSTIIVLRRISRVVEQSFPNNKLVEKGLLLPTECDELERIDEETPNENDDASWLPLLWAMKLISKARAEKWVEIEPPVFSHLEGAFDHLEKNNHTLVNHKKMNFPLAYRQVVTLHISCEFLGPSYKNYLLLRLSAV